MNEQTLKLLQNLSKMLGADRVLVKDEVDAVLGGIFKLLAEYKKTTDAMNSETRALVDKLLNQSLDIYEKVTKETANANKKQSQLTEEALAKIAADTAQSVEEIKYLMREVENMKPRDGMDADEEAIIERVLQNLEENKKDHVLNATEIIEAINNAENDTDKIDWERIKNVPAAIISPKSTNAGVWQVALRNAVDLDMSTRADGYAVVWDEAAGRFKFAASGGGGGGSGTVNSGTQYRLAHYATTGTAVSQLAAITASRLLVSNTNGLPTHSSVTATEAGYLSGVTSAIQTQLNAKQSTITTGTTAQYFRGDLSLSTFPTAVSSFTNDAGYITGVSIGSTVGSGTAGSILFVGTGGVVAQNNANFFWDDANTRLILGTNALDHSSSTAEINVVKNGLSFISAYGYGAAGASGGFFAGYGAGGTAGSPTAAAIGTTLVALSGRGYDGTSWTSGSQGSIVLVTAEAWSSTARGTNITFNTTPIGSTTNTGAAIIGHNGNMTVGSTVIQNSRFAIVGTRSSAYFSNGGTNFTLYDATFTDTSSSGTVSYIRTSVLGRTTYAASTATVYTDASTFYIAGTPIAGTNVTLTNSWSLYVASGASYFAGAITAASTITATGAVTGSNLSGTNTGDQTITLTGAVTGSGTGSFVTTLASGIDATKIGAGAVSSTEFGYLDGVTSAIQTQLNAKQASISTGTTAQYFRGDLSLATFPTALSSFSNDSGYITATSTTTLTNKRITRRLQTVTSSATVTPSADNDDDVMITAQAAGLTIANPTGTPTDGQTITVRIKDNGTTRTIAFGSSYRAIGVTLPTATTANKTIYIGCKYNSADTKWDVNAVATEA